METSPFVALTVWVAELKLISAPSAVNIVRNGTRVVPSVWNGLLENCNFLSSRYTGMSFSAACAAVGSNRANTSNNIVIFFIDYLPICYYSSLETSRYMNKLLVNSPRTRREIAPTTFVDISAYFDERKSLTFLNPEVERLIDLYFRFIRRYFS
jgi:hypothetical protein